MMHFVCGLREDPQLILLNVYPKPPRSILSGLVRVYELIRWSKKNSAGLPPAHVALWLGSLASNASVWTS